MKSDNIDSARVVGVMLGAFAIFAVLMPEVHNSEAVAWRWLLLTVLVPVCYATHHNFAARFWPTDSDSYQVACGEALYASMLIIVVAAFNWQAQDLQSWNEGHSAIVVMALISLVDIWLYFELIRLKGPIFTSHANYFMVASGLLWGMVIFGERPGPLIWISVLLLFTSLYLLGDRKTKGKKHNVEKV
jgi:drug/metabolite transporter (DMT)-like permease